MAAYSPPIEDYRRSQRSRPWSFNRWQGLLFALPAIAIVAAFLASAVFRTVEWSFFEWNGISPTKEYIGLDNYRAMFDGSDPYLGKAVRNTVLWVLLLVPAELAVALALAVLLNRELRFRVTFRTIFFLPVLLSPVVIGLTWGTIFFPDTGLLNQGLSAIGLDGSQAWLDDPSTALYAAMVVSVWRYAGLFMVFYLAALQMIPASLYESARVDGASEWLQFRRITFPLLLPTTALLALFATVGALREFDVMWVLTRGGPAHATDLVSLQIFNQGFTLYHVGYASAIAVLMLLLTAVAVLLLFAALHRAQRYVR